MTREELWMRARCGRITASELGDIVSASGKIIETNLTYIRSKRWERRRGYTLPVSSHTMDVGNETEPTIYEWLKDKVLIPELVVYSKDEGLPEIPFWIPDDMPFFGASPDAFTSDHKMVWEFKTLVGNEATFFFMDAATPYAEKKARVVKEHGDQIIGLFLSEPKVEQVTLIKYAMQRDDIPNDTDSPLAAWRGIKFDFLRKDYEVSIAQMRDRIILFNAMIDAPINPSEFKNGNWVVKDGKLCQIEK